MRKSFAKFVPLIAMATITAAACADQITHPGEPVGMASPIDTFYSAQRAGIDTFYRAQRAPIDTFASAQRASIDTFYRAQRAPIDTFASARKAPSGKPARQIAPIDTLY
jgi:hypothetical protein